MFTLAVSVKVPLPLLPERLLVRVDAVPGSAVFWSVPFCLFTLAVSVRVPLPLLPERLLVLVDAVSGTGVVTGVSGWGLLFVVSFSWPQPQAVIRGIAIANKILSAFIMYRLASHYLLQ